MFTKDDLLKNPVATLRSYVLQQNRKLSIKEIADFFSVDKRQRLIEGKVNSTIAQLIGIYLKQEGFKTERVNFSEVHGDYEIYVYPPKQGEVSLGNEVDDKNKKIEHVQYSDNSPSSSQQKEYKIKSPRVSEKYEYCSGCYTGLNPNFIVFKIKQKDEIPEELAGCLKILKNIFFRGIPVRLSKNLIDKFSVYFDDPVFFEKIDKKFKYSFDMQRKMDWIGVIKGGDCINPALDFFEMMQKEIPQYANLFLPECSFCKFTNPERPRQFAVDFYSPFYKTVIEIDGSQHKESIQKLNDKNRNIELTKYQIKCLRVPTDANFKEKIDFLKSDFDKITYPLTPYENVSDLDKILTYVFRFQIALLEAYEKGHYLDDKIYLKIDDTFSRDVFKIALEDFQLWLSNLLSLANSEITLKEHEIELVDSFEFDDGIKIDLSVSKLYDNSDINHNKDVVCIRNDFFKFSSGLLLDFPTTKNYFRVACSDFRFNKVTPERHHQNLLFFLENLFNFPQFNGFRPKQEEIVCQGLNPQNGVIGLLPTGSGKSVCFQLVGLLTPGISLVVEPLVSLMEDQCANLIGRHGVTNTGLIRSNKDSVQMGKASLDRFKNLNIKFLYISPERFLNGEFEECLKFFKGNVGQIVIDEVHTLSEWGHQFRTSYLLLFNDLLEMDFGKTKCLLMGTSGTASSRVIQDIAAEFKKINKKAKLVKSDSVKRPELTYEVIGCSNEEEKEEAVIHLVFEQAKNGNKSLVFTPYRNDAKELDEQLKNRNNSESFIRSDYFLGGDAEKNLAKNSDKKILTNSEKIAAFKNGNLNVICATKAFGMGLDIPDIRQTIHFGISDSVESMYQEMGRAGRDTIPSRCYVVYYNRRANLDAILSKFKNNFIALHDDCDSYKKKLNNKKKKITIDGQDKWIDPNPKCVYGDTYKQISLLSSSNSDVEFESEFIFNVWNYLLKGKKEEFYLSSAFNYIESQMKQKGFKIKFYKNEKKEDGWGKSADYKNFSNLFEKGLYKLHCLKLINLWKMNYSSSIDNPMFTNLKIFNRDEIALKQNLYTHIQRYDSTFKLKKMDENPIKNIFKNMCDWYFNTYFDNRWNSLKNLYDMITNFSSSEEFAERIESYFKTNEQLDMSVADTSNYQQWFDVINSDTLTALKDQIANKLTEFPNNLSVNFISGVVYLKIGEFENSYGHEKLERAFHVIEENLTKDLPQILDLTLDNLTEKEQKIFLRFLYDKFPYYFNNNELLSVMEKFDNGIKKKFEERPELIKDLDRLNQLRNVVIKLSNR